MKLIEIGKLLAPNSSKLDFDYGYENVYEWIYVDMPDFGSSLNISREHGLADLDDEEIDACGDDEEALEKIVKPGEIYFIGCDRSDNVQVPELSDELISEISRRLDCEILVFPGRANIECQSPTPIRKVHTGASRELHEESE